MKITEQEMRGLLAGNCLPGDIRLNEELPAYLVRKFDELQQKLDAMADKLARSEDYSVGVDAERMEYIKKCNAMAAENAALKSVISIYAKVKQDFDDFDGDRRGIAESLCEAEDALVNDIKTPATDVYLNSVRADAIESVVDALASSGALTVGDSIVEVVKLAEILSSGTHDTADRAGAK